MNALTRYVWLPLVNLLVPGGGMILAGQIAAGLTVGVLFVLCVNFAIAAVLLFPDDFPRWVQGLAIGVCGGAYVGAQIRLGACLRSQTRAAERERRDGALRRVRESLDDGRLEDAETAIRSVADLAEHDLLVAYRLAQVCSASGDAPAARAAWLRVRRLDPHRLYREATDQALRQIDAI